MVTDEERAQCVEACLACASVCDEAAGRLVDRGQRGVVDALIACVATTRLVADLLREEADIDPAVFELGSAACERCIELGVEGADAVCQEAVDRLRDLL